MTLHRAGRPHLRFHADAGVLPEAGRSEAGYRLSGPAAVGGAHAQALDAQIRVLRTRSSNA